MKRSARSSSRHARSASPRPSSARTAGTIRRSAELSGAAALNNTYFSTHYSDKDESVRPFIEAFQKEYNHAPNVFAALGYDAGKLLVDALKRAGSDDPEALRKAIEETKNLVVGTGTITMDAQHNPIKQAVILENKDGDRVVVAKIMPSM